MNLFYKNFSARMAAAILCAQILTGCSKEQEPGQSLSDGATLSVSVLGVTDAEEISSIDDKKTSSVKSTVNPQTASSKEMQFDGFDALVSVERDVEEKSKISVGSSSKGASGDLMAAAVPVGVRYRLLFYKSDGTFVKSALLTSGTAGQLTIPKGATYNWSAISYNNTGSIPDINPANPTLTLPANRDVLYAKGTINIPANAADGTTPLGIVFNHRLARIGIELNTMGMFANMNSAGVTVSGALAKTGTINLRTGALSNLTNYTTGITYSSFTNVDPLYSDRKIAYFYTADSTANTNLVVSLNALSIQLDTNTPRVFTNLGTAPASFTFSITPVLGRGYRAVINLLESPIPLGGVRWARNNLYYNGAGHNPYRFQHTYRANSNTNSFFSYRGTLPERFATGGASGGGDPCALVYPQGVWRQPTTTDFNALAGVNILGLSALGARAVTFGTDATGSYYQYDLGSGVPATSTPYPDNRLRFYLNGNGSAVSLVEDLARVTIVNGATELHLWSSSSLLNIPLLGAGVGAYYFEGTITSDLFGNPLYNRRQNAQILNISAVGLAVAQSDFKNVRCVRAAAAI